MRVMGAGRVMHGTNLSKVSAVGSGMRTHTGVAAQMFASLAKAGISIEMITTSEIKISVLVDRDRCEEAVRVVHEGFELSRDTSGQPSVGWKNEPRKTSGGASRDELQREVVARLSSMEDIVVSEVQLDADQSRVTIANLPDVPGVATAVFTAAAEGGMMVDMIIQNVGHAGNAHLSFTVPLADLDQCLLLTREVVQQWPDATISFERRIAKLSAMGIGLRSHTGVGEKMFRALAEANINVQMINTSEIRMSAVVAADQGEAALATLLKTFDLR